MAFERGDAEGAIAAKTITYDSHHLMPEARLLKCRAEVTGVHRFFEHWFNGDLPDRNAAFARFESVPAAETCAYSGFPSSG